MEDDKKKSTNKTLVNIKTAKPFGIVASKAITAGSLIAMRDSILATNKSLYGEGSAIKAFKDISLTASKWNTNMLGITSSITSMKDYAMLGSKWNSDMLKITNSLTSYKDFTLTASKWNTDLLGITNSLTSYKNFALTASKWNTDTLGISSITSMKDYAMFGSKWNSDMLGLTSSISAMKDLTLTASKRNTDMLGITGSITSMKDYAMLGSKWNSDMLGITNSLPAYKNFALTASKWNTKLYVDNPLLSMQASRLDNSVSSIVNKLFTTVYEDKSEPDLVTKFQEISKKFENCLETPEIPESFVTDIIGIKESINSMEDSDIKNELNLISQKFKIIGATAEDKTDLDTQSLNTEMIIGDLSNKLEILTTKLNHVTNLINQHPANSKKSILEEIKSKLTIAFIVVTIIIQLLSGFINKVGEAIFEESHLQKKIHQIFHPNDNESNSTQEKLNKTINDIKKDINKIPNDTNLV